MMVQIALLRALAVPRDPATRGPPASDSLIDKLACTDTLACAIHDTITATHGAYGQQAAYASGRVPLE